MTLYARYVWRTQTEIFEDEFKVIFSPNFQRFVLPYYLRIQAILVANIAYEHHLAAKKLLI